MAARHSPPSALLRAALTLTLLLGFYALTLGIAAGLFVLPGIFAFAMLSQGKFSLALLLVLVACWIPAGLLVVSVFKARRAEFVPPKRRLERSDAPELFSLIDDLGTRAGTVPPSEVYLSAFPELGVTEVGGVFKSRRVLIMGVPLLRMLTVDDLSVGIAHELGHFVGGDTRLTAFAAQTHALFASVASSGERGMFSETSHIAVETGFALAQSISGFVVGGYGRLFLRLTRPLGRRQEYAADALAARLLGAAASKRALSKILVRAPLYNEYLQNDVFSAVLRGAMPTDLVEGFERMRDRIESDDEGQRAIEELKQRVTDPYDTHPAPADRLRALDGLPSPGGEPDDTPAVTLFADAEALQEWLVEETLERMLAAAVASEEYVREVRLLEWSEIASQVYARGAHDAARRAAERLHPMFPEATSLSAMYAAVWRGIQAGRTMQIATRLNPDVPLAGGDTGSLVWRLSAELLVTLLQGALLEQGAVMDESLGDPSLALQFGEERVIPAELVVLMLVDGARARAEFERWAQRLGAGIAPE